MNYQENNPKDDADSAAASESSLPCTNDLHQRAPRDDRQEQQQQQLLEGETNVAGETTGEGQPTEVKVRIERLSLWRKLLIVAEGFGLEAGMVFEALYLIPVLQTLGLPLRTASMTGFVSGPVGAVLVPLVGWLSDKGTNPHRRKMIAVILSATLMVLGLAFIAVSTAVYSYPQGSQDKSPRDNITLFGNVTGSFASNVSDEDVSVTFRLLKKDKQALLGDLEEGEKEMPLDTHNQSNSENVSETLETEPHSTSHDDYSTENFPATVGESPTAGQSTSNTSGPTKPVLENQDTDPNASGDNEKKDLTAAGLAMSGFVLFELGFDLTATFVRVWILACGPRSEHTSLLVLAMVVSSVGGMSSAALGRVDFPSILNLDSDGEGDSHPALLIQSSIHSALTIVLVAVGMTSTLLTGHRLRQENDAKENDVELSDDLLVKRCDGVVSESEVISDSKHSVRLGEPDASDEDRTDKEDATASKRRESERQRHCRRCSCSRFSRTIASICFGMYFTCGTIYMFNFMISDYVGKAVYGGDPRADPGSDSLAFYVTGVRTAAWGLLVQSVTYMLVTLLQSRILALLGHKVQFVLVQLVTGGCMVLLAVTARLELFFLLCVVAGLHRSCLYVVPFAAVNDVVQAKVTDSKKIGGKPQVGLGLSVVGAMIPLSYTTLFPWVGPLTEFTGVTSTPLWVAAIFACLAAAGFVFVRTEHGCRWKCRKRKLTSN